MADVFWRHPANTEVARVYDVTPANVAIGDVFTLTATDDDGNTESVSFTATAATVANVTAGLTAAWNASTNPLIAKYTAADETTKLTLTATKAGVQPAISTSTTNGGGADTQTLTATESTVGVGNNNYDQTRNWSTDALPTASDDVILGTGSVSIKYGLDQSSVAIGDFFVEPGYSGQIGRFEDGVGYYLQIDPDDFRYEGRGSLALFDIGSANISPFIKSDGRASTSGRHAVYIKGSNIATLEVVKGDVGVAALKGDTATVATIICGFVSTPQQDVNMVIGEGVTLTTLTQTGGTCELKCGATTVNVSAEGTLTTEGTGAITTMNAYGTVYPNSTGTIGTLNAWGTVDFSRDRSARTVTTLNLKPGAKVIVHSGITITTLNGLGAGGSATLEYVD